MVATEEEYLETHTHESGHLGFGARRYGREGTAGGVGRGKETPLIHKRRREARNLSARTTPQGGGARDGLEEEETMRVEDSAGEEE